MINFVQAVLVGETNRELFHTDLAERPPEVWVIFMLSWPNFEIFSNSCQFLKID